MHLLRMPLATSFPLRSMCSLDMLFTSDLSQLTIEQLHFIETRVKNINTVYFFLPVNVR